MGPSFPRSTRCIPFGPFGLFGSLEHPSTGERCGEEAVGFDGGELAHGGGGRGLVPEGTPYLEGILLIVLIG